MPQSYDNQLALSSTLGHSNLNCCQPVPSMEIIAEVGASSASGYLGWGLERVD